MAENLEGELFLVATPIGNLEDMTFRAVRILQEADLIAAEDTRESKKLLNHFEIHKPMLSYHQHNQRKMAGEILKKLEAGAKIALICDAGTPGISDPGADLSAAAIEQGFKVTVIPGACALLVALTGSGLNTEKFVFEGFLPRKQKQRREALELLKEEQRTLIFYEAPHRLLSALGDLAEVLGQRRMVVCRELTKRFEEYVRGNIQDCLAHFQAKEAKGELVLIVEGQNEEELPEYSSEDIRAMVKDLLETGISRKAASKIVAEKTAKPARDIYALSLED